MTFQFRFTVFSSSFQSHGCLTVLPSRPARLLSILRDELLGQGQPDYSKLEPACCNPTQAPAASESADTTLQKTLSLTERARENKTMQGDLKKYCVSLLPVWTIAETSLWQQREAKTSESAAAVFLWSQTGSQGAASPRHPPEGPTTTWGEGFGATAAPAQLARSRRLSGLWVTHFGSLSLLTRSALTSTELQDSQLWHCSSVPSSSHSNDKWRFLAAENEAY